MLRPPAAGGDRPKPPRRAGFCSRAPLGGRGLGTVPARSARRCAGIVPIVCRFLLGDERAPVAAEERALRQRRQQAALLREPRLDLGRRARARAPAGRRRARSRSRRGVRFVTVSARPRGTTSGRACSECGATKVIAIASSPQTSTGPPFERLYAVEPEGVEQIRPSQGCEPRSSPPIAQSSSIIRPIVELATTMSLTASQRSPPADDLQRGQLDELELAGERAADALLERVRLDRREEADASEVDAEHGHAGAEEAPQRPQHRPVAAEHDREVGARDVASAAVAVLGGLLVRQQQLDRRAPPRPRAAARAPRRSSRPGRA